MRVASFSPVQGWMEEKRERSQLLCPRAPRSSWTMRRRMEGCSRLKRITSWGSSLEAA